MILADAGCWSRQLEASFVDIAATLGNQRRHGDRELRAYTRWSCSIGRAATAARTSDSTWSRKAYGGSRASS
jgi:hypothetical protein